MTIVIFSNFNFLGYLVRLCKRRSKIVSTTFTRYLEKKGIFYKNIVRAFDKEDRLGDFRTF